MRKYIACIFLVFGLLSARAQHYTLFSQYMFNGLLINPAYAGSVEALSITGINRQQWTGFDGSPKTTTFSLHSPLRVKSLALGLVYINDLFGITNQNKINAAFAYRLRFKKSTLSFGLQAGVDLIKNNWNKVVTTTPGDVVFTSPYSQSAIPQAGFGIYYKTQKFYAGISVPELLLLGNASSSLYRSVLFNAGYIFEVGKEVKLKPSVLVKYINASPAELDANINAYFKGFGLGYSYRTNDAMVFMATYNITQQFIIGYSYDLTTSALKTYVRGSHEFMLRYDFTYKVNTPSARYF